jgi:hypothetical protein
MNCKSCEYKQTYHDTEKWYEQIHTLFRKYEIPICSPCILIELKNDEFHKIAEWLISIILVRGEEEFSQNELDQAEAMLKKYKHSGLTELTRLSEEAGGYPECDGYKGEA